VEDEPGKKIDASGITENLRLGPDYNPPRPHTHFHYRADKGLFSRAALRCVGVGECRREGGQVMCPSYMVTREEKHCTRGRAHLLWEMLNGEVLTDGWKSEPVKEALDLCLACKGCKGDCPVNVDMATYKAEFLSHYYEGRLRPRHAYSMGWIYWWARLASGMPDVVNFLSRAPVLGDVAKFLGGIAPQRKMPAFARETFKDWFRGRGPRNQGKPPVILWPDTFTNHFNPDHGKAAGRQVWVPERSLCCGRSLYDFGMLDTAKALLRDVLAALRGPLQDGIPVVGLEPSCVSVFRDELTNLFPDDPDAQRLNRQAFVLSEYLMKHVKDYQPPRLERKALVHGHCHHKSVIGLGDELELLKKMGLDFETPEPGCCGMAGSFGFERGEHYNVSVACGERNLLPAVRQAGPDTLIIADGFSCEQQIRQGTGRMALHIAEALRLALHQGELLETDGREPKRLGVGAKVLTGAAVALGGLGLWKPTTGR
jgi:Fe-S oxidoreductase